MSHSSPISRRSSSVRAREVSASAASSTPQKFAHDIQSRYSVEELYAMAKAEKASLHDRMELMARVLWPKYMGSARMPSDRLELIGAVIDAMSAHHTTPYRFVEMVRRQIPKLEKFVRDHDLVDQDPTRPLVVR